MLYSNVTAKIVFFPETSKSLVSYNVKNTRKPLRIACKGPRVLECKLHLILIRLLYLAVTYL
jgi:hypothetical protein